MTDQAKLREAIEWAEEQAARWNEQEGRIGWGPPKAYIENYKALAEAARSTLPKTKVETAYYVTVDPVAGRIKRLRFTSDHAALEHVQRELQRGAQVTIERPRQEEVPA